MEAQEGMFEALESRIRNAIAQAGAQGRRVLAKQFVQATWRLNEAEAQVHASFFDERWQHLPMPFGQRRNARIEAKGVFYFDEQPIEHRGATPISSAPAVLATV